MSWSRTVASAVTVCAFGWSAMASAGNPPANGNSSQHDAATSAAGAQANKWNGFGVPVSVETLKHYSGGALITNTQAISGTVSNDSASQVVTGNNAITGDAFSSASGLPSVIQNTGNNVLIQNGVIVNVEMKQ